MGNTDAAAGLRLLYIYTLPLPTRSPNTAAGRGPGHRYTRRRAGRELQPNGERDGEMEREGERGREIFSDV